MRAGVTLRNEQAERSENPSSVEFIDPPVRREAAAFRLLPGRSVHHRSGGAGRTVTAVGAGGEKGRAAVTAQLARHEQGEVLVAPAGRRSRWHADLQLPAGAEEPALPPKGVGDGLHRECRPAGASSTSPCSWRASGAGAAV